MCLEKTIIQIIRQVFNRLGFLYCLWSLSFHVNMSYKVTVASFCFGFCWWFCSGKPVMLELHGAIEKDID